LQETIIVAFKTGDADEMMNRIRQATSGGGGGGGPGLYDKIRNAQDAVLSEMRDWIRDNHEDLGGWINRFDHLQNSIAYNPSEIIKSIIRGYLKAGMEYAPYVEVMEGHWVLSGAINEYRNRILSLIAEGVRAQ